MHRVGRTARNGRSGVAYSLVAPEEMCYLIDLHLFLGAPVQNKPAEGVTPGPKDAFYGSLPRHILDLEVEWARETTEHRVDLVRHSAGAHMQTGTQTRPTTADSLIPYSRAADGAAQVDAKLDEDVLEDRRHRRA